MIVEIHVEQWDCILIEAPSVELIPKFQPYRHRILISSVNRSKT